MSDATPARDLVQGVNHVAVSVTDIRTSVEFYQRHFGLELLATQPAIESIPGMAQVAGYAAETLHGSWALLAAGPINLELVSYRSPEGLSGSRRPPADRGLAHLAFRVSDVDEIYRRLVDAGVPTRSIPTELGRDRAFYAHGPDGELIEILERDDAAPPLAEVLKPLAQPARVCATHPAMISATSVGRFQNGECEESRLCVGPAPVITPRSNIR
jgi:catechol 2,3-dioxygenase-like lactoylglutathione lyase family enzyme